MGYAVWIDREQDLAWAQGTHEYRPVGTAVIGRRGQFRNRDFAQTRRIPPRLEYCFAGFYGSLEEVNAQLRSGREPEPRWTPAHLR